MGSLPTGTRPSYPLSTWANELQCRCRYPVDSSSDGRLDVGRVAALEPDLVPAKGGDPSIASRQVGDETLAVLRHFLQDGTLPEDEKVARKLLFDHTHYTLLDGVLYRVMRDSTLRLVPPTEARHSLFREAHAGAFGGHLRAQKVHSQLSRHYWWEGMCRDIVAGCRACMTCATRRVGKPL